MEPQCQFVLAPRCFDDIFGRHLKVLNVYVNFGKLVIHVEGVGYPVCDPESLLTKEFNSLNQMRNWIGGQVYGSHGQGQIHDAQSGRSKRRTSGQNAIQRG